jgi:hypothetical protein
LVTAQGAYTVQATDRTTGCIGYLSGNPVVGLNPAPNSYNVFAGEAYCLGGAGSQVYLEHSEANVNYELFYNGMPMTPRVVAMGTNDTLFFGLYKGIGGFNYTVNAEDRTTHCKTSMAIGAVVSINPLPTVYNVTGGGPYCANVAGVSIILEHSEAVATYDLYRNGVYVESKNGWPSGDALDFSSRTDSGVYTIVSKDNSTGCEIAMNGSPKVSVDPLPAVYNVSGTGSYCAGNPGRHVSLDYSITGISYELFRNSNPTSITKLGTNSGLDFGVLTGSATGDIYTVIATNVLTTCSVTMSSNAVLTEYTLPTSYTIAPNGPAPYCTGDAGIHITLPSSDAGSQYQLYRGTTPLAIVTSPSTGGALDFGNQTIAGTYTILARNPVTTCGTTMPGATQVILNGRPTAYPVTGGGHFCTGDAGKDVILTNTSSTVDYQLYNNGNVVPGMSTSGTGSSYNFGPQPAAGNYTVIGTDRNTNCTRTMTGSATLIADPLPLATTVTGGGSYCVGGSGHHIRLSASSTGNKYQLQLIGGGNIGAPLSGTGSALDFGLQTTDGAYQVTATNSFTHCSNVMGGGATIIVNNPPNVYPVSGSGSYCEGAGDAIVTLAISDTDVNYQLMNGTTGGAVVPGTPSGVVTFPAVTTSGTYTVKATDVATTCSTLMSGTATMNILALPADHNVTGGGSYCSGSAGVHIGLDGSNLGGFTYEVYNDFGLVGSFWSGTGMALDLGAQTVAGTYSVVATNSGTSCSRMMTGTASVSVIPSVTPAVTLVTSTGNDTVCSAIPTVYSASAVNEGTAPTYQWRVNGSIVSTASTFSYSPATGDVVSVKLTSNAVCPLPATVSDAITMNVIHSDLPTAVITPSTPTSVCPGTPVNFTATTTFGGDHPVYSWQKNGEIVSTDDHYSVVPNDSDIIFLAMTSDFRCRLANTVFSNNVLMDIIMPTLPGVEISANPGLKFVGGSTVIFTAVTSNTSALSTYKWKVNGNVITGATSSTYTTSSLKDLDIVTSEVTNHTATCSGTLAASRSVTVHDVTATGVNTLAAVADLTVIPNPNNGAFTVKGNLISATDEEVSLEVTNMLGQVVYSSKNIAVNGNINEQIRLTNLANGMYLLNVRSASANSVFHFVIEQ